MRYPSEGGDDREEAEEEHGRTRDGRQPEELVERLGLGEPVVQDRGDRGSHEGHERAVPVVSEEPVGEVLATDDA